MVGLKTAWPIIFLLTLQLGVRKVAAQKATLKNIITTDRISSNHYSDIVLTEDGEAYIACFRKNKEGKDEVYICKINPEGIIEWTLGEGILGRATAITKDSNNDIWVTGFYQGFWKTDKNQHHSIEDKLFVLHLDQNGRELRWIENTVGSAKPYNIASNLNGEIMLHGAMGKSLGFNGREINAEHEDAFFAIFDSDGDCKKLYPFGGAITKIQAFQNGFIITGRFHTRMSFMNQNYVTTGPLDNDGFIALYDEENSWFYQFGEPGYIKSGYRTLEGGIGVVIDDSNKIQVLGIKDLLVFIPLESPDPKIASLFLITLNDQGKLISEKILINRVTAKSPATISKDSNDYYWISTGVQNDASICGIAHSFGPESKALLFSCNSSYKLTKIISMKHGPNTSIRSSYAQCKKIVFSGHYKECLKIEEKSIFNDGRHGLFYLSLEP